jgi:serine/threonine-protein kinase RsbW
VEATAGTDITGEVVRLSVPAAPAFVQLARLTGSALATRLGLTIDEVDDIRIGIDELAAVVVGVAAPDSTLDLEYVLGDDALEVSGTVPCPDPEAVAGISELSEKILDVVVDVYGLESVDGRLSFRLEKRRQPEGS